MAVEVYKGADLLQEVNSIREITIDNYTSMYVYDGGSVSKLTVNNGGSAYIDENGYPMPTHEITRPPQSWCYVESEVTEE